MNILASLRASGGKVDPMASPEMKPGPAIGVPPRSPTHIDYAEEAKRAAQRYLDQQKQIEALAAEIEAWRNRATLAEGEAELAARREVELKAEMAGKQDASRRELDAYKETIAILRAQYSSAAKILLDGLQIMDQLEGTRIKISTSVLAAALSDEPSNTGPLPSVVAKGPDNGE